jgi:hypothetical protein
MAKRLKEYILYKIQQLSIYYKTKFFLWLTMHLPTPVLIRVRKYHGAQAKQ